MSVNADWYLKRLKKHYPNAYCALDHTNPLELLVATILSAQCTDERVNKVTPQLFKKNKSAQAYAESSLTDLEALIRSTGFFRSKARAIQGMAKILVTRFGGNVPQSMDDLVELPGVGRKTANVVMGNAFGIASGVVVDTHVSRLSQRLGLTREKKPEKIESELEKIVPRKDWVQFSHWLITHGRAICKARGPLCADCFLRERCPKIGVTLKKNRG